MVGTTILGSDLAEGEVTGIWAGVGLLQVTGIHTLSCRKISPPFLIVSLLKY